MPNQLVKETDEIQTTNQCVFCCLYDFSCDFLEFPSVKSSKIFTAHCTWQDTNFKHEKSRVCKGGFFDFFLIYVFYCCQKTGLIDFPGKQAQTKVRYLLTVCQILWNFTKGNSRKFTVSFAFCPHVDIHVKIIEKH